MTAPDFILDALGQELRVGDRVVYNAARNYGPKREMEERWVEELLATNYLRLDGQGARKVRTNRWRVVKLPPK